MRVIDWCQVTDIIYSCPKTDRPGTLFTSLVANRVIMKSELEKNEPTIRGRRAAISRWAHFCETQLESSRQSVRDSLHAVSTSGAEWSARNKSKTSPRSVWWSYRCFNKMVEAQERKQSQRRENLTRQEPFNPWGKGSGNRLNGVNYQRRKLYQHIHGDMSKLPISALIE